jgi:membrane-bound serine protease (ClpP class)
VPAFVKNRAMPLPRSRCRHADGALVFLLGLLLAACALAAPPPVTLLTIDGPIGPASADYVVRGITRAAGDGSQLVILQMDTPGGLDTSMRAIIKAILASPVPVASHVAPGGARAASAGTYILYASHIAAMAPGTNLGAATPVQIGAQGTEPEADKPARGADGAAGKGGSALARKQVNDAAAYIRGLAQMRGRNADWAERAVREAVSLPADEALKLRVIDYLAPDTQALMTQLDDKTVTVLGQEKQLHLRGAALAQVQPDWRVRLLSTITSPTIALLLLTVGVYGLVFEFMSPGAVAPGVIGAICLLLALYGLQLLPVNYAGLALILLALLLMVAEAFLPSFGALGIGGVAAFVAGALMLIDTDLPGYGLPLGLIAAVAVVSALLLGAIATMAVRTRRRPRLAGLDDMVGGIAEVEAAPGAPHEAWARLRGETWRVVSSAPLRQGQRVRVVGRNGLLLNVVPIDNDEQGESPCPPP